MQPPYKILLLIMLALLPVLPHGRGLSQNIPEIRGLPDSYNENYIMFTDRSLYAIGEEIRFVVLDNSPPLIKAESWSKIIYLSLLKPDGTVVSRGKYVLEEGIASSMFEIPEELLTGQYYLCAYSRWMRNFSPSQYTYTPLKILNPFSDELEQGEAEYVTMTNENRDTNAQTGPAGVQLHRLVCTTERETYAPGEEIRLSIRYPGVFGADKGLISVSVARPGALDTLLFSGSIPESAGRPDSNEPALLPDLRGPSLTGRIIDGDDPVTNVRVELSIFGNPPVFMSYRTGNEGYFSFSLDPFIGNREMFISAKKPEGRDPDLNLDEDNAANFASFPAGTFSLNNDERDAAREIMINMQLRKMYREQHAEIEADTLKKSIHGVPVRKLWIDEFIELPNLREVFIELVPEVTPRMRNRKSYLSFSGNAMTGGIMAHFDPLILIDQIPVYDIDKLLALSPKNIRSIEVINEVYVIGSTAYGGFINIESKKRDGGGIDLPEPSYFFRMEGISGSGSEDSGTESEFSNCLYWEPEMEIAPEEERTISLRGSGLPGKYTVVVRGLTEDRSCIFGHCSFRILPAR